MVSYPRSDNAVDGLASGCESFLPLSGGHLLLHPLTRTRHLLPPPLYGRKEGRDTPAQPHPPTSPLPAHGPLDHRHVFTIRHS